MQSEVSQFLHRLDPRRRPFVGLGTVFVVGLLIYLIVRYLVPHSIPAFEVAFRSVPWTVSGPGLLDATNKVVVTARIQGRLTTVAVQRNDSVVKGQVIATLDSEDLQNQLIAAQADAEAAQRAVVVARSQQAKWEARLTKLAADVERRKQLLKTGSVSPAGYEAVQAEYLQAKADLEGAIISIQKAQAQSRSANANVKSLAARLDDTRIVSPLDGVVISREKNVGDVIVPGASIVQLVDPSSIIVSARFDESVMGVVSVGQPVAINFTSEPRRIYKGHVTKIGRQVDQETREFTVETSLNALPRNWALGQRTSVEIEVSSSSDHLLIPQQFVRRADGLAGVWISQSRRARWRHITIGFHSGPLVEATEGLRPGDIVLSPHGRYSFEFVTPDLSK